MTTSAYRGPLDGLVVPRFNGPATFARLPRLDEVPKADVAVVGVPFDSGVSYCPGARFGPAHVRASSKLLRTFNPVQDIEPFAVQQVVDAGDITCNPFDIGEALRQIDAGAREIVGSGAKLMTIGGDHTIALPLLRDPVLEREVDQPDLPKPRRTGRRLRTTAEDSEHREGGPGGSMMRRGRCRSARPCRSIITTKFLEWAILCRPSTLPRR
jgi:hypothetical protein